MPRYSFQSRSSDRFSNYRTIVAKFDSTGSCGHPIKTGEEIGYHPKLKRTSCATCWAKWVAENAEAEAQESGYGQSW